MNLTIIKANYSILNFPACLILLFVFCLFACNPPDPSTAKEQPPAKLGNEEVLIEYLAHASFRLHHADHILLLDPFADSIWIAYDFPEGITADAIFSTHPHYDHDGGLFRGLHPYWEGKIPFYQDPGTHIIGSFKIEGIKGRHCDPYGKEFGQKNTIWIFEVAGLRIAHWGDNAPMNDTIAPALTDIDILMVPIDDEYHILKKEELEELLSTINPRIIIPMHYKIAELEKRPGLPKDLGTIEQYLTGKKNVIKVNGNSYKLSKNSLPDSPKYLIFQHSPQIKEP